MVKNKPDSLQELFNFYYTEFKPLYDRVHIYGQPPLEMLFEITAAFDHLSRHWYYNLDEKIAVEKACSHLKRASFDAFKIILINTIDKYNELLNIDTSIIDNGNFDMSLKHLMADIESGAEKARMSEGDSRDEGKWHVAFELWKEVYLKCYEFEYNYYLNDKVEWAKKRQNRNKWVLRLEGLLIGIIASLIAAGIFYLFV